MGLGIYAGSSQRPTEVVISELQCKDSANESNVSLLTFAECSLFSLY